MAKLTKTHGKAQEDSWQSSSRLMAKLNKSHGKAQEVSWQSSRRLMMAKLKKSYMAKLKKTRGKGQEDSWQSSKITTTQVKDNQIIKVKCRITKTPTPQE